MIATALVLPTPVALLAPASVRDPVAELRRACEDAVAALPPGRLVVVAPPVTEANRERGVTEPLGQRVAAHLLGDRDHEVRLALPGAASELLRDDPAVLLVMADGSASRGAKAPGHLHPAAMGFDEALQRALADGDAEALTGLDRELADAVWCQGEPALHVLGEVARGREITAETTYADAPYGVAWWVVRWDLT